MTVERGSRPNVHFDMASHNTSLHFEMTLKVFNVVGITKGGQGRSCGLHSVCGESLKVGDLIIFESFKKTSRSLWRHIDAIMMNMDAKLALFHKNC